LAKQVLKNAYVSVNAVDLSDHVASVTVNDGFDEIDSTTMGMVAKSAFNGLADPSIEVEFFQDYASTKVDATLHPFNVAGAATCPVVVRPDSAAASATNPQYTLASRISGGYQPIAGAAGAPAMVKVTFKSFDGTGFTRVDT
jgi:hypothetical protein